ncbi:MAG: type II secretion system F family protein [Candidatus Doudnabacteria bacterium]|nr:type II secretion system F family protein [Candidatus Doudnabacteria bacterium]
MSNPSFLYLSIKDQILFAKRLAILIKAGTPILTSLQLLNKQNRSRSIRNILKEVIADVENGSFLSVSLKKFRKIFGDFAVNIIEIGEVSGTLPENLNYLAEELKKKQALRRKVVGALIYPGIIILATLGITLLLTVYVFPRILPIFESVSFDLPWTTKALIFVSDTVNNHGIKILIGLAAASVVFWLSLRVEKVRLWWDRFLIAIPVLGTLLQCYHMANLCRTLGLLLKSEILIVRAATITANTSTNMAYRRELHRLSEGLTRGGKISTHFEKSRRLFPDILTQMVSVGEATGNLSQTLLFLSDMYEGEVDEQTKNLSTVLEPILMVFMGIIVGFVAISIITPIYEITQHLNP